MRAGARWCRHKAKEFLVKCSTSKAAIVAALVLGSLGVAQAAQAHTDVVFSIGVQAPAYGPQPYAVVPQPVYAPAQPVYVAPQPVYTAPVGIYAGPGYAQWRREQWRREEWRREQWRREQWREQQWHESHDVHRH
jgi:hypothetical protein